MNTTASSHEYRLHIGNRSTGFTPRPDAQYPNMWRIYAPTGQISDFLNLTRAKDAATLWARPRGLGGQETPSWNHRETTAVSSYAA
jgi:hypothetical protein